MLRRISIVLAIWVSTSLIVALGVHAQGNVAKDGIEILYPRNGTVVFSEKVHVVGRAFSRSHITASVGSRSTVKRGAKQMKTKDSTFYFFTIDVELNRGENRITLTDKAGNSSEVTVRYTTSAAAYRDKVERKTFFHMDDSAELCEECHDFKKIEGCMSCHQPKTNGRFVHGPVAAWQCFQCHDRNNFLAPIQPISNKCLECHQEFADNMFASKVAHGPTVAGYCNICHDPHASEMKFLMKDDTNTLCENCHVDKKTGVHVLAGATGGSHPTEGKTIEATGEPISCVSCHNPHYGANRSLFADNAGDFMTLCIRCHQDKL